MPGFKVNSDLHDFSWPGQNEWRQSKWLIWPDWPVGQKGAAQLWCAARESFGDRGKRHIRQEPISWANGLSGERAEKSRLVNEMGSLRSNLGVCQVFEQCGCPYVIVQLEIGQYQKTGYAKERNPNVMVTNRRSGELGDEFFEGCQSILILSIPPDMSGNTSSRATYCKRGKDATALTSCSKAPRAWHRSPSRLTIPFHSEGDSFNHSFNRYTACQSCMLVNGRVLLAALISSMAKGQYYFWPMVCWAT
jgi:hypothetical protein